MNLSGLRSRVSFNAPLTLSFFALCIVVRVLGTLTGGASDRLLFSVYRASLADPLTWPRFILHALGHSSWGHLMNNMLTFLILAPMLEEKYGARRLGTVMLASALVTGIVSFLIFPRVRLLGASGIVFSLIVLSSFTATEKDRIPLSFLLVVLLYLGQQVYEGLFVPDNVAQFAHIAGGAVGAFSGFAMNRRSE